MVPPMTTIGRNVWFELMTSDMKAADAFYGETVGWKGESAKMEGMPPYTMWKMGEETMAGMMAMPAEVAEMGIPPHWMAYTTVEDVDAAATKAAELGGKILKAGFTVPNVGRMAMLADPQGAPFAVFTPDNDIPTSSEEKLGKFSWVELNTTDYESAWKFYAELFSWQHSSSMEMGEMGTYFMFDSADKSTKGGMSNTAAMMKVPAHWLYYVTVDNCDAAAERITKNGGKILNGPMDIPGGDRIAQCMDPQGAAFAIYSKGQK
jgi:predicted enzyme related to lactoylglutathione lyase